MLQQNYINGGVFGEMEMDIDKMLREYRERTFKPVIDQLLNPPPCESIVSRELRRFQQSRCEAPIYDFELATAKRRAEESFHQALNLQCERGNHDSEEISKACEEAYEHSMLLSGYKKGWVK